MKMLLVPAMHCDMCVSRIQKALESAGIDCRVTLADKTVAVAEEKEAETAAILDELGFEIQA